MYNRPRARCHSRRSPTPGARYHVALPGRRCASLSRGRGHASSRAPGGCLVAHVRLLRCAETGTWSLAMPPDRPAERGPQCTTTSDCVCVRASDAPAAVARHVILPRPQCVRGRPGTSRTPSTRHGPCCEQAKRGHRAKLRIEPATGAEGRCLPRRARQSSRDAGSTPAAAAGARDSISKTPMQNGQLIRAARLHEEWRPHGDSNPGVHRERVVS